MVKIFSIKEVYSERIYSNKKRVEFRRQNVNIRKDETCLVYTSHPVKKITGYFIVGEKIRDTLENLWDITKEYAGISLNEFKKYFSGCSHGTAIIFRFVKKFKNGLSLETLKKEIDGFRPPQSYYNINTKSIFIINHFPEIRIQENLSSSG